jgi:acetyl/propionyl-CoA carboxylase alpha subunit
MALFNKVVVANRGAVAARVLRTLNAMGLHSVAVYSDADRDAPYLSTRARRRTSAARRRARAT